MDMIEYAALRSGLGVAQANVFYVIKAFLSAIKVGNIKHLVESAFNIERFCTDLYVNGKIKHCVVSVN